jgi:hypothetical protein
MGARRRVRGRGFRSTGKSAAKLAKKIARKYIKYGAIGAAGATAAGVAATPYFIRQIFKRR